MKVELKIFDENQKLTLAKKFKTKQDAWSYAKAVMHDGETCHVNDGFETQYYIKSRGGDKRKGDM